MYSVELLRPLAGRYGCAVRAFRERVGSAGPWTVISSDPTPQPAYMDYDVTNGQGYTYRIRAVDTAGFVSADSPVIPSTGSVVPNDTVPPARPTGVKAVAGPTAGSAVINWLPVLDPDLAGYVIYVSTTSDLGSPMCDPDGTDCSDNPYFVGTGLAEATEYYFTVRSYDTSGNESLSSLQVGARTRSGLIGSPVLTSAIAAVDDNGTPAPTSFTCQFREEDDDVLGVALDWEPAPGTIGGYRVYRADTKDTKYGQPPESVVFTPIATLASSDTSYHDVDLNEFSYSYYVVAFLGFDESLVATPGGEPAILPGGGGWDPATNVRNVVALDSRSEFDTWNETSRKVRVKWSRVVAPEVRGYHVYRRCDWKMCDYSAYLPNMETASCEHSWVRLTSWPIDGDLVFTDETIGGLHGCYDYAVRPVGPNYQEGAITKIVAVDLRPNFENYSAICDGESCHCYQPEVMYHHDTKASLSDIQEEKDRIYGSARGAGVSGVGSPQAPTGLTVSTANKSTAWPAQRGTRYARVDWSPNAEVDIAGYHVEMAGSSSQDGLWERLTKNPVAWWDTHYEVKGLGIKKWNSDEYIGPVDCAHFRVIAVDDFGNESPPGYHDPRPDCADTQTLPAPQSVVASTALVPDDVSQAELDQYDSSCAVRIDWDDVPGATSFDVYRLHLAGSEALYFYRTQSVDAAASCANGQCSYIERGDYDLPSSDPNADCPWRTSFSGLNLGWCDAVSGLEAYYITSSYMDPVSGALVEGPRSKTVFWQCDTSRYPEGYVDLNLPPEVTPGASPLGEPFQTAWNADTTVATPGECLDPPLRPDPVSGVNWARSPDGLRRAYAVTPLLTLGSVDPPYEILDLHVDHLGSTRLITDESGAVATKHDFFPFGEEIAPQNDHENRKFFTGHERDKETGLDYMLARYYSDRTTRFLSVDPSGGSVDQGRPQTWNRYSYAENNPIRLFDPDGAMPLDASV